MTRLNFISPNRFDSLKQENLFIDAAQKEPGDERIEQFSTEDWFEKLKEVINWEPVNFVDEDKKIWWKSVEEGLNQEEKRILSNALFLSFPQKELSIYLSLISTPIMSPYVTEAFIDYFSINKETISNLCPVDATLFLNLIFENEQRPKERHWIFSLFSNSIKTTDLQIFFLALLETRSPGLLYTHVALVPERYLEMEKNDEFFHDLLYSWDGSPGEKSYIVNTLLQSSLPEKKLLAYEFSVSDSFSQRQEEWSFNKIIHTFENLHLDQLVSLKETIERIPPLLISIGMKKHSEIILKWISLFDDPQLEAYGLSLPEENLMDTLTRCSEILSRESFSILLNSIQHDISDFIINKERSLRHQDSRLFEKRLLWENAITHKEAENTLEENLESLISTGEELLKKVFTFIENPLHCHFSPPKYLPFSNKKLTFVEIQMRCNRLKSLQASKESDDIFEEPFSVLFQTLFTEEFLSNLNLRSFDELAKGGITCDDDLKKLGITPDRQECLYQIQKIVENFGAHPLCNEDGECVGYVGAQLLLGQECFNDENLYTKNLRLFCYSPYILARSENNVTLIKKIFEKLLHDFPETAQKINQFKNSLEDENECYDKIFYIINFLREHRLDYVLRKHSRIIHQKQYTSKSRLEPLSCQIL